MVMARLTVQEQRDLRVVFDVYDPASTGVIDLRDLRKCLRVLGFKCSRRRLQQLMAGLDKTACGIDFEGFCHVVVMLQGTDYDSLAELQEAFTLMDMNHDEQLSIEDLQTVSKQAGVSLTATDLRGMVEEADQDGDGQVSLQEFIRTMMRTALFS